MDKAKIVQMAKAELMRHNLRHLSEKVLPKIVERVIADAKERKGSLPHLQMHG
jgi:hypothetical protein